MGYINYYDVLGVSMDATLHEIKQAYRKLVKKYHPDINNHITDDAIKLINLAYEELINPITRNKIDTYIASIKKINKPTKKIKLDIYQTIEIPLIDILLNKTLKFTNIFNIKCKTCDGIGGSQCVCSRCNGSGNIKKHDVFISIELPCTSCKGYGYTLSSVCKECNGTGVNKDTEIIDIPITENIIHQKQLIIPGKGHKLNKHRGDLIFNIEIIPDLNYSISNNNIIYTVDIDVFDILLEKTIELNTIKGSLLITITTSNYNKPFIISKYGIIDSNGIGDMVIHINPAINKLTELQKEHIQEYILKNNM